MSTKTKPDSSVAALYRVFIFKNKNMKLISMTDFVLELPKLGGQQVNSGLKSTLKDRVSTELAILSNPC